MQRSVLFAALLGGLAAWCPPAGAADCAPPGLVASLDIRDEGPSGVLGFSVPVVINGQQRRMRLTLGPHTNVARGFLNPAGVQAGEDGTDEHVLSKPTAKLASLTLGVATGTDLDVGTVADAPRPDDPVGSIGTGILANFDMEIDFAVKTVRLFQHEACAGAGVRWAARYASVPFDMAKLRKVSFAMELDGKSVTVTPWLESTANTMPLASAVNLFGLKPDDPGAETWKPDAPMPLGSRTFTPDQLTVRWHRFSRLSSGDFVIAQPNVILTGHLDDQVCNGMRKKLLENGMYAICFGVGDLALGLEALRHLHLYFAFKEQVLYVTPTAP